jgi:hypothetical protein
MGEIKGKTDKARIGKAARTPRRRLKNKGQVIHWVNGSSREKASRTTVFCKVKARALSLHSRPVTRVMASEDW